MIYIKDMDMPVDCLACRISCKHESYLVTGRPKDCPLEEAKTGDLISRADAIEAVTAIFTTDGCIYKSLSDINTHGYIVEALNALPSAEAVHGDGKMIPIELKKRYPHSRDEDITDAFMRGYKAHAEAVQGWIPCSERLPKAEDMYQPPEQRYLCQLEAYGERKFCVLSRLKGAISPFWDWYGVAVHDSEVTAWMPLPKPYKGGDSE